jgi:hydrogenase maturation protease
LNASEGLARNLPVNGPILVIGVGNEHRTDDAVGLHVARRLKQLSLENVMVIEENGEGASLLESWKGADTVISRRGFLRRKAGHGSLYRWAKTTDPNRVASPLDPHIERRRRG